MRGGPGPLDPTLAQKGCGRDRSHDGNPKMAYLLSFFLNGPFLSSHHLNRLCHSRLGYFGATQII